MKQKLETLIAEKLKTNPEYQSKTDPEAKKLQDELKNIQTENISNIIDIKKEKIEAKKKIFTETKENQTKLRGKFPDKIPEKLSEEQETEALKTV